MNKPSLTELQMALIDAQHAARIVRRYVETSTPPGSSQRREGREEISRVTDVTDFLELVIEREEKQL